MSYDFSAFHTCYKDDGGFMKVNVVACGFVPWPHDVNILHVDNKLFGIFKQLLKRLQVARCG